MSNASNSTVNSSYDIRDYTIKADCQFPETFCLETVPVKNQWFQPNCVPHAIASACEYHYQRQHGCYVEFSTEFINGLREEGYWMWRGMSIRDGLKTLLKYGNVFESDCPGNHDHETAMANVSKDIDRLKELAYPHRISAYFKINTVDELKTALMKFGVVIVSMKIYDWSRLVGDVFTCNTDNDYDMHCVFIYGWNEKGWLAQNSWGSLYGGDGRFVIPFNFEFNERYGIADDIIEGVLHKPKRNKLLDVVYLIINKFINLILNLKDYKNLQSAK